MQQAQRQVESYIRDAEKRVIAGNTYLKQKRKLKYLNQLTEITLPFDVLIWGRNDETVEISNSVHTIICYDFIEKPDYFGFEEVFSDQYSCVLKRRTNG